MWERKNIYYSLGRVRTAKLVKMYFIFQPATSVLALELSGRRRRQGPLGYVELTIKVIGKWNMVTFASNLWKINWFQQYKWLWK